jgi:hypothetical protein
LYCSWTGEARPTTERCDAGFREPGLALCRSLLNARRTVTEAIAASSGDCDSTLVEEASHQYPACQIGRMIFIQVLTAAAFDCLPAPMVANTS